MNRPAHCHVVLAALVGLALSGTACKPDPPPRPAAVDAAVAAAPGPAPASQRLTTEMRSNSYRITDISIQGTDMGGAAPAPPPVAKAPTPAPGAKAPPPAPPAPKAPPTP